MLTVIHLPVNFHRVFNGNRKFTHRMVRGEWTQQLHPSVKIFLPEKYDTQNTKYMCFNAQGQLMQYVIAQRNEGFSKLPREGKNKTKTNNQLNNITAQMATWAIMWSHCDGSKCAPVAHVFLWGSHTGRDCWYGNQINNDLWQNVKTWRAHRTLQGVQKWDSDVRSQENG